MSDTPVCDANYFDSEPHGYGVVPLCVARQLERELNRLKEKNMQTIPSNLNAEELLRWYDSLWNKLTNSEMEQRLADALKEALDELKEQKGFEDELEKAQDDLSGAEEKIEELEGEIERAKDALGAL